MADLLQDVVEDGLPGNHHFFITFGTTAEGVEIADWMMESYPEEMTIVLQHQYDDLEVTADGFGVTLTFNNVPHRMIVPFDAIRTFVDPSVEFGLRFDGSTPPEDDDGPDAPKPDQTPDPDTPPGDGGVISLDAFRKS